MPTAYIDIASWSPLVVPSCDSKELPYTNKLFGLHTLYKPSNVTLGAHSQQGLIILLCLCQETTMLSCGDYF